MRKHAYLEHNGVRTRPIFGGNLARQPFMQSIPYLVAGDLKNSDYVMENSFWIGCHDSLSEDQMDYLLKILADFFKSREIIRKNG